MLLYIELLANKEIGDKKTVQRVLDIIAPLMTLENYECILHIYSLFVEEGYIKELVQSSVVTFLVNFLKQDFPSTAYERRLGKEILLNVFQEKNNI